MKGLAAVMLRSSQATNDAEAVRVLRASLLSMHEKLADKESALQRLAALHARLLAAHDDLQADSTAGAMPRHTALRQSSRDSAVGELKISALAVDEEPHWIAMTPAAGSTAWSERASAMRRESSESMTSLVYGQRDSNEEISAATGASALVDELREQLSAVLSRAERAEAELAVACARADAVGEEASTRADRAEAQLLAMQTSSPPGSAHKSSAEASAEAVAEAVQAVEVRSAARVKLAEKAAIAAEKELARVRDELEAVCSERTSLAARLAEGTKPLEKRLEEAEAELMMLRASSEEASRRAEGAESALASAKGEVAALRDAEEASKRRLAAEIWRLREEHEATLARSESALSAERARLKVLRGSLDEANRALLEAQAEAQAATTTRGSPTTEAANTPIKDAVGDVTWDDL